VIAIKSLESDLDFLRISNEVFAGCPSNSIDYAGMEQTEDAVLVPMDAGWSDIGSRSSLRDIKDKHKYGNVTQGDVVVHNSTNCYVTSDGRLIAIIGVDDLDVVDTKDVIMVAHRDGVQDVKIIAQQLKASQRSELELHRPWGKYDAIDSDENYQVKRLTVKPGAKLSVQMHYQRFEHWVAVAGQARVHYGNVSYDFGVNEPKYHGKEVVHALENIGDTPPELIEVQVGSHLGEDDIVRFDDVYGRIAM
jgi:mannose-1-phosphate guanylyltransferase